MKIVDKRGEVNFNQWMKMAKGCNGLTWWGHNSARANACTDQAYSSTWASAHVRHNRVDGGGIGFGAIFEDIWEINDCALIICSSCNVSQSFTMY
jgi:hypothetical protein